LDKIVTINLKEKQKLEQIWQSQAPVELPPVNLTSKNFPASWVSGLDSPTGHDEVAGLIRSCLGWPDWVRLYRKPIQALAAARELARSMGKASGVIHIAPGTGQPLHPPKDNPGLAVLRADWAPDGASMLAAQEDIRAMGLYLLMDESATGFRLDPKGAAGYYGLEPDAVLLGPGLAGGLDFAALAGKGQAPPDSRHLPADKALIAARAILSRLQTADFSKQYKELGRLFLLGLDYYSQQAGVRQELDWEGPDALPRLSGRRLWAFIRLAEEEGLIMQPLVYLDPALSAEDIPPMVWARLARAAARLKVLPEGEMAPLGWRDAAQSTSCNRAAEILATLEEN
jgi:hypothetical protein